MKNIYLKSFFLMVLAILLEHSSEGSKIDTLPTIHINPDMDEIQNINLSDIVFDVKAVKLETNSDCLIGYFSSLIHIDQDYIFFETDNKTILIFDSTGKFINKIDSFGNGPNEYNNIISTAVDTNKKEVYIMDNNKVLVFGYDCKFIRKINTTILAGGFFIDSNSQNIIAPTIQKYEQNNRDLLHILDYDFNIIKSFKSRNTDVITDIRQNLFYTSEPYKVKDKIFYKELFVDTIYQVNKNILKPYWIIDLDEKGFETYEGINTIHHQKAMKSKIAPIGIKENISFFILDYSFRNAKYFSLFEKKSKKYIFHKKYKELSDRGITNDLIIGAPKFCPDYVQGDFLISLVNSSTLTKEQQDLFKRKDNDNPILFIATSK